MELPQPRPFGAEGKKPTHDFLSLYSDPSFQPQDPRSSQGFYLRTHDFLQPLERSGKSNCIEETREKPFIEKPPSAEHILPGGIGTYSISQIPTFGRTVAVKTDKNVYSAVQACGQERNGEVSNANSNSSPCNGGAFTLWGESAVKEKTMMKDKMGESQITREPSEKLAQYLPFASRASGFNPMMTPSNQFQGGQKNQGFMDMLRSVKGLPEDEDDDEDDYVKKEVTSHKEDFGVKVDGKGNDQRANTPRSKHSATEQRRRSKINDRFQILRQLIPHSDQKRDKASFLLEVIEYIQFLQEKVQKYEAAFPGCNQDIAKFSPWKHSHGMGESMVDHSQIKKSGGAGSGLMFAGKFEDNGVAVTSSMLGNAQNPVESDNVSSDTPYKATDHHPGLATKAATAAVPLQQSVYNSVGRNSGIIPPQNRFLSDAENMASQPQQHLWQRSVPADSGMSNEQEELTIEGGTIHLSSVYSQGLLSSLTKALQSSGIDLSQANVSVQIDLGKRAITRPGNTSSAKDHEDPLSCNRTMAHSRGASSADDSDQVQKKPRIDRR